MGGTFCFFFFFDIPFLELGLSDHPADCFEPKAAVDLVE